MTDPWWKGNALTPSQHEAVNARHYPGTRQLCVQCDEPTGRCEEDGMWDQNGNPLCEECYSEERRAVDYRQEARNE